MMSAKRGEKGQVQVNACGWGGESSPIWTSTQKLQIESTDVILSSARAKKLVDTHVSF